MDTVAVSKNLITASVSCIATSQALAAAGNLVINGASASAQSSGAFGATQTIAVLDTARRVLITSAGNDSGRTFTLYGTRQGGQAIQENLTGASGGAVGSVLDYLNVGRVAVDGAIASTVTVGTSGTGSTDWIMPNFHLTPFDVVSVQQQTGSVTWNFETTNDMGWWVPPRSNFTATPQPNVYQIVTGSTLAQQVVLSSAVTGYRYTITAGAGTLVTESQQSGIVNY